MKRFVLGALCVFSWIILTSSTFAQVPDPPANRERQAEEQPRDVQRADREGGERGRREEGERRGKGPRGGGGGGNLLFRTLDADGDGTISADEMKNALAALKKLDKNNDGQLTRDELRRERDRGERAGEDRRGNQDRERQRHRRGDTERPERPRD